MNYSFNGEVTSCSFLKQCMPVRKYVIWFMSNMIIINEQCSQSAQLLQSGFLMGLDSPMSVYSNTLSVSETFFVILMLYCDMFIKIKLIKIKIDFNELFLIVYTYVELFIVHRLCIKQNTNYGMKNVCFCMKMTVMSAYLTNLIHFICNNVHK